jgi:DNA-binding MarR family transcriptional regulator
MLESVVRKVRDLTVQDDVFPRRPDTDSVVDHGAAAQRLYQQRRLRDQFFHADIFAEPAWDMLLDLFAAAEKGQRIYVTSLCIAAAVPATTALRWITLLEKRGLVVKVKDDEDGRKFWIELAPATRSSLERYLARIA